MLAVAVLSLSGCAGSDLKTEDPDGYAACIALRDSLDEDASTKHRLGGLLIAGERARTARTADIRHAKEYHRGDVGVVADVDQMTEACEAAGVEVD